MSGAVCGTLSPSRSARFRAHLLYCAACRTEFDRLQMLGRAIDGSLRASLSAEASPRLVARVRQALAEQPPRAREWRLESAWLKTAGICAALVICFLVVPTSRKAQPPVQEYASVKAPSVEKAAAVSPNRVLGRGAGPSRGSRQSGFARRQASVRAGRRASDPEIIVEPGQMSALLRLAAAIQSGQISGVDLLADRRRTVAPLEIEPLTIAPLRITADESNPQASRAGGTGKENLESGRSN